MNFDDFKAEIMEGVREHLEENGYQGVELSEHKVDKMNDSYEAITVKPADSAIGVNLNVDAFYAKYQRTNDLQAVIEDACNAAERGIENSPEIDVAAITNYEQMKDKLTMEVVSAERNAELLKEVPHEQMEDMAVIYRIVLGSSEDGIGTVLVTNQLMEKYGITHDQLRQDAMEKAPEIRPSEIKGMSEVMEELAPGMMPEIAPEDEVMFVASNPEKVHGAGVIAYPNFLEDAAKKLDGDFYILPSSIHEILLVRDNGEMDSKQLGAMVREVNATQVEPQDQLTDNVYHYDSKNHVFELAEKFEQRQLEQELDKDAQDLEQPHKDSVLEKMKEKKEEIAKQDSVKEVAKHIPSKGKEVSL
ncbi:DUF5688 family protein [Butyrivibrio sp. INlla14]|uniref:DUF5688 family protein n=1 Tax=Butyrivibrio sp. INlla14 TaxID=1520808 RepID=UPI0008766909|nr:DUF5688 family protein [Butyrivibrio sp. INlla14]SCY63289.1 hypothetical protein SAMN02910371_03133 [Butyrivibrio sp. INlla14]